MNALLNVRFIYENSETAATTARGVNSHFLSAGQFVKPEGRMDKLFALTQGGSATISNTDAPPQSFLAPSSVKNPAYRIRIVPALSDNYMYLITSTVEPGRAVAVDPCDAKCMSALCTAEGVELVAILTTHYHADHSGGNAALKERLPHLVVVAGGPDMSRTPAATRGVEDGESLTLAGLAFTVLATPCHTRGHVTYVLDAGDGQSPAAFTGDTLFLGGCGRFMEGGASQMRASLDRVCGARDDIRIFCGHEYTTENLRFAASLDPDNPAVIAALARARECDEAGQPTVPSTVAQEREYNPFLRVCEPYMARKCGCAAGADPCDVLAKLRRKKDTYTTMGKVITFVLDVKSVVSPS